MSPSTAHIMPQANLLGTSLQQLIQTHRLDSVFGRFLLQACRIQNMIDQMVQPLDIVQHSCIELLLFFARHLLRTNVCR